MKISVTIFLLLISVCAWSQKIVTTGDFVYRGHDYSYRLFDSELNRFAIEMRHDDVLDTFYMFSFDDMNMDAFVIRLSRSLYSLNSIHHNIPVHKDSVLNIYSRLSASGENPLSLSAASWEVFTQATSDLTETCDSLSISWFIGKFKAIRSRLASTAAATELAMLDQHIVTLEKYNSHHHYSTRDIEGEAKKLYLVLRDRINQTKANGLTVGTIYMRDQFQIRPIYGPNSTGFEHAVQAYTNDKQNPSSTTRLYWDFLYSAKPVRSDSVIIVYEEGVIRDIQLFASANYEGHHLEFVFSNRIPFPSSSRNDINSLKTADYAKLYLTTDIEANVPEYYVKWSDVFVYNYLPKLYTDDLSPKDCVVRLNKTTPQQVLNKEETKDLFQAVVYTDLVGLSDDQPNGLIQTLVSKRILLNTKVHPKKKKVKHVHIGDEHIETEEFCDSLDSLCSDSTDKEQVDKMNHKELTYHNGVYSQYFKYIEPYIQVNKWEEDNKRAELATNPLPGHSEYALNGIDLRKYRDISIGVDWNHISITNPNSKLTVDLGLGIEVFRTRFANTTDSITLAEIESSGMDGDIVSMALAPRMRLIFSPETRYEFHLVTRLTCIKELQDNFVIVDNPSQVLKDNAVPAFSYVGEIGIVGTWRPNIDSPNKGRLFFRANFMSLLRNISENHLNLQIGYAFNIISARGKK